MLVRLLLTDKADSPFAARCWLTSVTTACSAALKLETFAVDAALEDVEGAAVEPAVLDDVEEVGLEEVVEVVRDAVDEAVWDEAEDAGLEDVEDAGADAAAEVWHPAPADAQPAFCDEIAADGQDVPEVIPQGVLFTLLQEDVLQAAAALFCPNSDWTYCCTSLQVPWTQETTVLQAEFIGLQELAV